MNGVMALFMMENGLKIELMALVIISGLMAGLSKVNGKTTICMETVFIHGKMGVGMKVST